MTEEPKNSRGHDIRKAIAVDDHDEVRDLGAEQKRLSKEAARLDRMADQMTAAKRAANPVHELSSGKGIKMPAATPAEVSRAEAPEKPTLLLAAPKPMLMLEAPRESQTLESIRAQAREHDRRAQELEEHINRAVAQGEHDEARDLRAQQKGLLKEAQRLDRMADDMTRPERIANPVHELSSGEGIKMPAATPAEVSRAEAPEKPTLLLAAPKPMLMLEAPRESQTLESIRAQAREHDRRAQELEEHINRAVAQGEHGEARDLRTEQKRLSKEAARLDRMADQMTAPERAANSVHELSSGEGIKMQAITPARHQKT